MFKKDVLYHLLRDGSKKNIKYITLIGNPTVEFLRAVNDDTLQDLFELYLLDNILSSKNISTHSNSDNMILCCVRIPIRSKANFAMINFIRAVLFEDVKDCYQGNIKYEFIEKIVHKQQLTFADMLEMIDDTQTVMAKKIGKSKQLISDLKNNRINMSMDTLKSLLNEYPLLPWYSYITNL